ncbi:MAG: DUF4435 domain-containing protein, partial [Desulfobacteraceae bacterium]|nr:DUF4435 domain-containing protein [Desulfobacteraceae bacterium]
RWFPEERDWLEFKSVDTGIGGGCKQVIKKVDDFRAKKLNAFGIVDRDALLQCNLLSLLWETDDEKYKSARPFGDYIYPLRRWELENYLLDPDELEHFLADSSEMTPWEARPRLTMITELIAHCEILIPIMAANVLLHENKIGALDFGFSLQSTTRDKTEMDVREQLLKKINPNSSWLMLYNQNKIKIESFAEDHSSESEEYWDSINRIIDGKRILKRIKHHYKIKEKMIYRLARGIKREGRIDPEIQSFIEELREYTL